MRQSGRWFVLPLVIGLWLSSLACAATAWLSTDEAPVPTGSTPPVTPSGERLGAIELKYVLIDTFGPPFFCDPDYYPVARDDEQQKALEWFGQVDLASEEMRAILARLRMVALLSDEDILMAYREHKLLGSILVEPSGTEYRFEFRLGEEPEGETVSGRIDDRGRIDEEKREPGFNTCPICLAAGTLIDTPSGPVAVQELQAGMAIWTVGKSGARTAAVILRTGSVPVPEGFALVRLRLEDGRQLVASPGHPLRDDRRLGELQAGEMLDGARVVSVERVPAVRPATYDVLPAGGTGLYWANGILVRSTLAPRAP
ncbi:MAG TPA: Hint domain-containing protein [Anaerolineales bacterium]